MLQPIDGSSDLSSSDAHAILESQEPAPPYDLDPAICMRVGDVIARAATLSSRPAWVVAVMEKSLANGADQKTRRPVMSPREGGCVTYEAGEKVEPVS